MNASFSASDDYAEAEDAPKKHFVPPSTLAESENTVGQLRLSSRVLPDVASSIYLFQIFIYNWAREHHQIFLINMRKSSIW